MLSRIKLTTIKALTDPNVRTVVILSTLVIAAMVGGAPSDFGGTGR